MMLEEEDESADVPRPLDSAISRSAELLAEARCIGATSEAIELGTLMIEQARLRECFLRGGDDREIYLTELRKCSTELARFETLFLHKKAATITRFIADIASLREGVQAIRNDARRQKWPLPPSRLQAMAALQTSLDHARVMVSAMAVATGEDLGAAMREYRRTRALIENQRAALGEADATAVRTDEGVDRFVSNWSMIMAAGGAGLSFGGVALLHPNIDALSLTGVAACYCAVVGVARVVAASLGGVQRRLWPMLVSGAALIVGAVLSLNTPTLRPVLAGMLMLVGLLDGVVAFGLARRPAAILGIGGVASVLFGLLVAVAADANTAVLFGIAAMSSGAALTGLAITMRRAAVGVRRVREVTASGS
jgi:uncharacterized membrane protein HdeD (DUF308 family)